MSLMQVTQWNFDRNKLEYSKELEDRLWSEEVNEFKQELLKYLDNPLNKLEVIANMVKEYCDCNFVYYGTVMKQLGNTKVSDYNFELSMMNTLLIEVLLKHKVKLYDADKQPTIEEALGIVIEANNKKPKKKVNGKVVKGEDYIDPTVLIIDLLLERGFEEYPEVTKDIEEQVKGE